jgi:threonine/homoserine/homoserine lactone efflux protein
MIPAMLWAFLPIAALMTITPGPGTAMIVRSALRGGVRTAFATMLGNSAGVLTWAALSALGVSALVTASEVAFALLKVTGAAVLVYLGVRSLLGRRGAEPASSGTPRATLSLRGALRDGLATSLANPKLAVFFVALFPQFVDDGAPVLLPALAMAGLIVALDLAWYSTLAVLVDRSRRAFLQSGVMRRLEQLMGAVLIGLGVRVALEHR